MGPEKASQRGGVQVFVHIRMAMVMAVISGPPENAFLRGHGGEKSHHELKRPAGLEGAMGEITVISRGHKKHANVIGGQANDQVGPVELQKECRHAGEMNDKKRR